jgi:cell division septation protein DedD
MIYKYLVAAALLGTTISPVAAQSVRAGIQAWQHADYDRAVAIWRPLAEKGDIDAQFNLGQAYRLGRGVPTNLAAAATWFQRAAAKGHLDAQATLGLMLFENGDRATGLRWLKQAADKGEPRALLVYGTALFNGDGVGKDPLRGYALVSRSAAQGFAPAQATLDQLDQILPADQRKRAVSIASARPRVSATRTAVAPPLPASPSHVAPVQRPKSTPAPAPPSQLGRAPAPEGGGWRVQLGAFSQRASAEALFRKLSGALPGKGPVYVAAGPVTRLQVGPYASRAAAAAACGALHGQPCFPVPAK